MTSSDYGNLLIGFRVRFDALHKGAADPWPQFSRWLPNGQSDALLLFDSCSNIELSVWFERFGYHNGHFIEFDIAKHEVEERHLREQSPVHAGPLCGLLAWGSITESQATGLRHGPEDAEYIALGKNLLGFLQPKLADFIEVIRSIFGQYWVPSLPKWDSRARSLGAYCRDFLAMKWSLDDGATWTDFVPDELRVLTSLTVPMRAENTYLLEEDWSELGEIARRTRVFSTAAEILGRARYLLDAGQLQHAVVDVVTALEIAISETLRAWLHDDPALLKRLGPFKEIPLPARLLVVASGVGVSSDDLAHALEAINLRNRIVHEGCSLSSKSSARKHLKAMTAVISKLAQPNIRKSPRANIGYLIDADGE